MDQLQLAFSRAPLTGEFVAAGAEEATWSAEHRVASLRWRSAVDEEADVGADEQQPEELPESAPGPAGRPAPRKPGSNKEKALTLEVARLFGIPPQVLMNRKASPQPPEPVESITGEEDGETDADAG